TGLGKSRGVPLFLSQRGGPIDDCNNGCGDRERCRSGTRRSISRNRQEKALPVRDDIVTNREWDCCGERKRRLEKGRRLVRLEGTTGADGHGHEFSIKRDVIQLAAISSPTRFHSAIRRYLPSAAVRIGKRSNNDLIGAGFVGRIGEPPSIRR